RRYPRAGLVAVVAAADATGLEDYGAGAVVRLEGLDAAGLRRAIRTAAARARRREARDAMYRVLLGEASEGFLLFDRTGRIVEANPSLCALLGFSREELRERTVADLLPPEDLARSPVRWDDLAAGRVVRTERRLVRRDGATVEAEICSNRVGEGRFQSFVRDISERKRHEAELRRMVSLLRATLESTADGILVVDRELRIIDYNQRFVDLWRVPPDVLAARECRLIVAYVRDQLVDPDALGRRLAELQQCPDLETEDLLAFRDGRVFEHHIRPQRLGGAAVGWVCSIRDVTERHRAAQALHEREEQLRQAQRLEAVGRLAGGIAHDFNNVLTAIMGYADLLADQLSADDPRHHDALEIRRAAERAAALTRQLLAFSRRQVLQPVVLDINNVVASVDALLRRLIGDEVELVVACDPAVGRVMADPGQIEQVIMNLVVNARDAMPDGGRIVIATGVAVVGEGGIPGGHTVGPDLPGPGRYVTLRVTDTGHGIPPDVLPHIFEPFFTTKPSGKGTGLGLATVYGIVKQSGGHIVVETGTNRGTTFTIYLPETQAEAAVVEPRSAVPAGCVLLVEDETAIRILAGGILRRQGYQVLDAATGEEALALLDRGEPVDLLLTDVVMPGMNGVQLAEAAVARRPGLKVVYMSGFSQSLVQPRGGGARRVPFLPKPFTPAALVQMVRSVLNVQPEETSV
ncbi:MAG TPA: PAS domain S-box protein, partial [Vicinamibacterales bacterium]|nr:PAS domain S-box protein [Vicinamibacterales bacterium]